MKILIDNGHGKSTSGKRSPDGKHREYLWAREFAAMLKNELQEEGYDAMLLTPEEEDVSITRRCLRANAICNNVGASNVILISIHNDAKGSNGQWMDARGFSTRVSLNASKKSKDLASFIAQAANDAGVKVRVPVRYPSVQWYWPQNLGICRDTKCPAVLVENLFQDNREDVALLHDEGFLKKLCDSYIIGIKRYIEKYG